LAQGPGPRGLSCWPSIASSAMSAAGGQPLPGGTAAAPMPISCGGCGRSPSQVKAWNGYVVYKRGTADETRTPKGDACYSCAVAMKRGSYDLSWSEIKERARLDPLFRQELSQCGDLAVAVLDQQKQACTADYGDALGRQTVVADTMATVTLRSYGKLLDPEEFKAQHGGVSHTDLGLTITTLRNKFGEKSGILVEDDAKPAEVIIDSAQQCRLSELHLTAAWHVRPAQGKETWDRAQASRLDVACYGSTLVAELLAKRNAELAATASAAGASVTPGEDNPSTTEGASAAESAQAILPIDVEVGISLSDDDRDGPPRKKARRGAGTGRVSKGRGRGHLAHVGAGGAGATPTKQPAATMGAEKGQQGSSPRGSESSTTASSGPLVHIVKGSNASEEYLKKLVRYRDILEGAYESKDKEGNAKTIGQDIYQAERIRKSLFSKDGRTCRDPVLAARLKHAVDTASLAKELQKDRIILMNHKDLKSRVRALLLVCKSLPIVTQVELWKFEIKRAADTDDWAALAEALQTELGDGEDDSPNNEVFGLRHLCCHMKPEELGPIVRSAIAEYVLMPKVQMVRSEGGEQACEKAVECVLAGLPDEGASAFQGQGFGGSLTDLFTVVRGMGGLLNPSPGAHGATPDDIEFAVSMPDCMDAHKNSSLNVVRCALASADSRFQELHASWQKVALTQNSSAGEVEKHMENLQAGHADALATVLKDMPSLMVNLRPGATSQLEKVIVQTASKTASQIKKASAEERAAMMNAFWPALTSAIPTLPPGLFKNDLIQITSTVAQIHEETRHDQKIYAMMHAVAAVVQAADAAKDARWGALATALVEMKGLKLKSADHVQTATAFLQSELDKINACNDVRNVSLPKTALTAMRDLHSALPKEQQETFQPDIGELLLVARAQDVHEVLDKFLALSSNGLLACMQEDAAGKRGRHDALTRILAKPAPLELDLEAEARPMAAMYDSCVKGASQTRDDAETQILQLYASELDASMVEFEPKAGGGEEGASWKDGLDQQAALPDVLAHAQSTILQLPGGELHASWKGLSAAYQTYSKSLARFKRTPAPGDDADQEALKRLSSAKALVQQGRATISEALILTSLVDNGGCAEAVVEVCRKQFKELAKAEAPATLLHGSLYSLIREHMAKK
jgi:hypothetical protein